MVLWIVLAVVVLALLVLATAVRAVLTRLPALQRAGLALQRRQGEADELIRGADVLQQRLAALQEQAETAQRRLTVIQAKRGERDS